MFKPGTKPEAFPPCSKAEVRYPYRSRVSGRFGVSSQVLRAAGAAGFICLFVGLLSTFSIIGTPFNQQFVASTLAVLNWSTIYSGQAPLDSCSPKAIKTPNRTPLGVEADEAFQVQNLCLSRYQSLLESFLSAQATSLELFALRQSLQQSWVNSPFRQHRQSIERPIPAIIHQLSASSLDPSWIAQNPEFQQRSEMGPHNNNSTVSSSNQDRLSDFQAESFEQFQSQTFDFNNTRLLKYSRLFFEGGVYVEPGAKCLRGIRLWSKFNGIEAGGDGQWAGGRALQAGWRQMGSRGEPSLILGIEDQAEDWEKGWQERIPRPLMISTIGLASSAYHPVVLDTMRRLATNIEESSALTDALLEYLNTMTEGHFRWTDLRSMGPMGTRVGDVLVLPQSTFSKCISKPITR